MWENSAVLSAVGLPPILIVSTCLPGPFRIRGREKPTISTKLKILFFVCLLCGLLTKRAMS